MALRTIGSNTTIISSETITSDSITGVGVYTAKVTKYLAAGNLFTTAITSVYSDFSDFAPTVNNPYTTKLVKVLGPEFYWG
jgi:hypothetical protein